MGYDSNKLAELQKIIDTNFDFMKGRDIELKSLFGVQDGNSLWAKAKNIINTASNVMPRADKVTEKAALRASMVDALYDVYELY
jgi:hypothetical protein